MPVAFENDLGMRFVLIPAGTFTLASPRPEEDPTTSGGLQRPVVPRGKATVARPFYMQTTEVTEEQYRAVGADDRSAGPDGSGDDGNRLPQAGLTRDAVREFAQRVGCRLPTEVEWARAAQGGAGRRPYPWGTTDDVARRNGPGQEDGHERSAPVGSYPPNGYGLFDMVGNVWEYCADTVRYQDIGEVEDLPVLVIQTKKREEEEEAEEKGPKIVPLWIVRGGSWLRVGLGVGAASRAISPRYDVEADVDVGLRLVADLPAKDE